EGISLGEVWPGILLDLKARGKNVEKIFMILPGGDPSRIRMRLAGAQRLRLDGAGHWSWPRREGCLQCRQGEAASILPNTPFSSSFGPAAKNSVFDGRFWVT